MQTPSHSQYQQQSKQTAPDAAAVRGGCPPPSTPSPLVQATHPSLYNMASPLMQPNVSPAACTARSKPAVPYHSLKSGQHVTFDPTGHPMTQGLSPSHADKGASRRAVVHASNFDALNATQHAGHLSGVRPIHSTNHREGGDSRVPHQPDSVGARSANQGGYMGSAEINVVQADSAGCVVTPPYNGSKMATLLQPQARTAARGHGRGGRPSTQSPPPLLISSSSGSLSANGESSKSPYKLDETPARSAHAHAAVAGGVEPAPLYGKQASFTPPPRSLGTRTRIPFVQTAFCQSRTLTSEHKNQHKPRSRGVPRTTAFTGGQGGAHLSTRAMVRAIIELESGNNSSHPAVTRGGADPSHLAQIPALQTPLSGAATLPSPPPLPADAWSQQRRAPFNSLSPAYDQAQYKSALGCALADAPRPSSVPTLALARQRAHSPRSLPRSRALGPGGLIRHRSDDVGKLASRRGHGHAPLSNQRPAQLRGPLAPVGSYQGNYDRLRVNATGSSQSSSARHHPHDPGLSFASASPMHAGSLSRLVHLGHPDEAAFEPSAGHTPATPARATACPEPPQTFAGWNDGDSASSSFGAIERFPYYSGAATAPLPVPYCATLRGSAPVHGGVHCARNALPETSASGHRVSNLQRWNEPQGSNEGADAAARLNPSPSHVQAYGQSDANKCGVDNNEVPNEDEYSSDSSQDQDDTQYQVCPPDDCSEREYSAENYEKESPSVMPGNGLLGDARLHASSSPIQEAQVGDEADARLSADPKHRRGTALDAREVVATNSRTIKQTTMLAKNEAKIQAKAARAPGSSQARTKQINQRRMRRVSVQDLILPGQDLLDVMESLADAAVYCLDVERWQACAMETMASAVCSAEGPRDLAAFQRRSAPPPRPQLNMDAATGESVGDNRLESLVSRSCNSLDQLVSTTTHCMQKISECGDAIPTTKITAVQQIDTSKQMEENQLLLMIKGVPRVLDRKELLSAVVQIVKSAMQCTYCKLFLYDPCTQELHTVHGERLEKLPYIAYGALMSGQAVNIEDPTEDYRFGMCDQQRFREMCIDPCALLTLPVVHNKVQLGCLEVMNKQSDDGECMQFSSWDVELLEGIIDVAAELMQSLKLHEELCCKQSRLLSVDLRFWKAVQMAHTLLPMVGKRKAGDVEDRFIREMLQMTGVDAVHLAMPTSSDLLRVTSTIPAQRAATLHVDPEASILGHVIMNRKLRCADGNVDSLADLRTHDDMVDSHLRALLCLPLLGEGWTGAVRLSRRHGEPFIPTDEVALAATLLIEVALPIFNQERMIRQTFEKKSTLS